MTLPDSKISSRSLRYEQQQADPVTSHELVLRGTAVVLREAETDDVAAIAALLADDQLGETRDGIENDSDRDAYLGAFRAIEADPRSSSPRCHRPNRRDRHTAGQLPPWLGAPRSAACTDRSGWGPGGLPRSRVGSCHHRVGDRGGPTPRLCPCSANQRQVVEPWPTASTSDSASPSPTMASNSSSNRVLEPNESLAKLGSQVSITAP